jgi:hypothetical protein
MLARFVLAQSRPARCRRVLPSRVPPTTELDALHFSPGVEAYDFTFG